jgi:hypothetical protein
MALTPIKSNENREVYLGTNHDGKICLTNNAAERALRGFALAGSRDSSLAPSVAPNAPPPWPR